MPKSFNSQEDLGEDLEEDLQENLVDSLISALGDREPEIVLKNIIQNLRKETTSAEGETLCGSEIANDLRITNILRDDCLDLVIVCSDYPNGLDLLRLSSIRFIRNKEKRKKLEKDLKNYAIQLDNQPAFNSEIIPTNALMEADLSFIDSLIDAIDEQIASEIISRVVTEMAQPGRPLSLRSTEINLALLAAKEQIKVHLKQLLASCHPSAIEEFKQLFAKANAARNEINKASFLLIQIDSKFCENHKYQFRAELMLESSSDPISLDTDNFIGLDADREPHRKWPKGTMEIFPKLLGQWLTNARKMSQHNLYLEIFLPHKLLMESPPMKIEIPLGGELIPMDLSECGTPFVLRSLDRIQMAQQRQLASLRNKCADLRRGNAMLDKASQPSQLEPGLLNTRLRRNEVAGLLMLLDLSAEAEKLSYLFWLIIDSQIPICAWWRNFHVTDKDTDTGETATCRLKYLEQCLSLIGPQPDDKQDLVAPQHLHAMEIVAKRRQYLSGEEECRGWIPRLMLLIDHPERWPKAILYEQEIGGSMQSQN